MGAEFDDLAGGEAEEAVGGDGVLLEEGEDRFGDGTHVTFGRGDKVVATEVIGDLGVRERDVGFGDGGAKNGHDVGIFHEAEGDDYAVEAAVEFEGGVAVGCGNGGLAGGTDREENDGFV